MSLQHPSPADPPVRAARRFAVPPAVGLALLLLLLAAGCGGRQAPEPLPSQTTTTVEPQLEPPPPDLPPPSRRLPPTQPVETVTVIDPGNDPDEPQTLVEASRLARRQKQRQEPPTAEITDENLHEWAEGASLIIAADESAAPPVSTPPATPASGGGASGADADADSDDDPDDELDGPLALGDLQPGGAALGEEYWRDRALELRMGWRRTMDEVAELELEAAALRQQFYAEEDLLFRDEQIKPQWDRALDRLKRLRERSLRYEEQLDIMVAEGRQNGVPQGWLNEGWELEPSAEELEHVRKIGVHEPVDTEPAAEAEDIE